MSVKQRAVATLHVPFDLGAGKRGASEAPNVIFKSGLERSLRQLSIPYRNFEPITVSAASGQYPETNMKSFGEVVELNRALADQVSQVVGEGLFPLVLGGDHSIAIGTIAGLSEHYSNLGVIWFDAHSDLNTEATTPSGNVHGMSLAVCLGLGHELLTGINGARPKVKAENVVIIGARSLDQGEKELIRSLGIACYTMHDVDRKGMGKIIEETVLKLKDVTDGVHLSFDVDSLDPAEAPGTGTPVRGGVSYREAHFALELLHESDLITSAEFVEVNPSLDHNQRTVRLAVELIGSLLGQTIL
jgi:arginase